MALLKPLDEQLPDVLCALRGARLEVELEGDGFCDEQNREVESRVLWFLAAVAPFLGFVAWRERADWARKLEALLLGEQLAGSQAGVEFFGGD